MRLLDYESPAEAEPLRGTFGIGLAFLAWALLVACPLLIAILYRIIQAVF